jgi:hypothetical protein
LGISVLSSRRPDGVGRNENEEEKRGVVAAVVAWSPQRALHLLTTAPAHDAPMSRGMA